MAKPTEQENHCNLPTPARPLPPQKKKQLPQAPSTRLPTPETIGPRSGWFIILLVLLQQRLPVAGHRAVNWLRNVVCVSPWPAGRSWTGLNSKPSPIYISLSTYKRLLRLLPVSHERCCSSGATRLSVRYNILVLRIS